MGLKESPHWLKGGMIAVIIYVVILSLFLRDMIYCMRYEQDPKSIPENEKVEAKILCAFVFIPFSQILFFPVSFIPFLLNKNPSFTFVFILDIILMVCFMFFVGAGIGNMIWKIKSKKKK